MKYLLDTDTISLVVKRNPGIIKKLKTHEDDEILVSSITYAEVTYGLEKKASAKLTEEVNIILGKLLVKDFDINSAECYGKIRYTLEKSGTPLDNMDILIAASAMSLGAILITHNIKHFSKIRDLKVEDWS
jgi:tRNA(fMet)-specific endonuclease VapC